MLFAQQKRRKKGKKRKTEQQEQRKRKKEKKHIRKKCYYCLPKKEFSKRVQGKKVLRCLFGTSPRKILSWQQKFLHIYSQTKCWY